MPNNIRTNLAVVERFMQTCMTNCAHDTEHVYRVLNFAIDIMEHENENENVDNELLIISCLLHDIGRIEQYANPKIDHAKIGAEKALNWLIKNNYSADFAHKVKECISTHRYRSDNQPKCIEAKILFDADKIDACGATGIARTLLAKAVLSQPLYSLSDDGNVLDGISDNDSSFFHEYRFKLEKLYDVFYTERGSQLALERKEIANNFYNALLSELRGCYSHSNRLKNKTKSEV